jgi:hypothetical protein
MNRGNFTDDDGWVTLTDQHPTALKVLNGKISSIHMEQRSCQVWQAINGQTTLAQNNFTTLSKK